MKKFLMTLVALVAISVSANAQTVYVSTGDGAVAYHKSKSCSYLSNSKDVQSVSTAEAKKMGRHECTRCYGTAAAAKKTTTTAKKSAPARDEKGRFIKKVDTEKKAAEKKVKTEKKAAKKTTPARDEKGRFIKKADTEKKAAKKATPARDEKGRFIKKADTEKKTTAKKTKKAA
jgi:DNA-binding protein HU-beta